MLDVCRKNGIKEIDYAELERRFTSSEDPHVDVYSAVNDCGSG